MEQPDLGDPFVRKNYRQCVDCVKRLDATCKDHKNVAVLFSADVVSYRNRLRDSCQRLMFHQPTAFGRKAEDMIWKKCVYEPVQTLRINKERLSEQQKALGGLFLCGASGYFHSLIIKLGTEFNIETGLDSTWITLLPASLERKELNVKEKLWAKTAIHKMLIYLGDLARYSMELGLEEERSVLAEYYYKQALVVNYKHGMPLNQLGTLYGSRNELLEAIYSYLKCQLCVESFEGVPGNIVQTLKKNESLFENLDSENKGGSEAYKVEFLHLVYLFIEGGEDLDRGPVLPSLCNQFVQKMVDGRELDSVTYSKIVYVQILLMALLKQQGSLKYLSAANLFYSTSQCLLMYITRDLSLSSSSFSSPDLTAKSEPSRESVVNSQIKDDVCLGKRVIRPPTFIARRRRGSNSDSSDQEDIEQDSLPSLNEVESEGEDSDGADIIELADSDVDDDVEDDVEEDVDDQIEQGPDACSPVDSGVLSEENNNNHANMNAYVQEGEGESVISLIDDNISRWLPMVKLMSYWIEVLMQKNTNPALEDVLHQFIQLINCFPSQTTLDGYLKNDLDLRKQMNRVKEDVDNDLEEGHVIALEEDCDLRCLPQFDTVLSKLCFTQVKLSARAKTILRMLALHSFARGLLGKLNISWDRMTGRYLSGKEGNGEANKYVKGRVANEEEDVNEGQKEKLMHNMGKLRMQNELARLDKIGWIPVYILPDTDVLLNKISLLKQLLSAQKFVIMIADDVMRNLDSLKKDSQRARDAFRWLETCLTKGSRYVRVQKEGQRNDVTQTNALPDSVDEKRFQSILEAASFLSGTVPNGGTTVASILTVLHGKDLVTLKEIVANLIPGVSVENVHNFNGRWSKYSGRKKRGG